MTPVWGHSDVAIEFCRKMIPGCERGFGKAQGLCVIDQDLRLVGAVVFYDWDPDAGVMQLSAAATTPRWLTRGVMNATFDYVFRICGCQMVFARSDPENSSVRRMWQAWGAKEYEILRGRGRDKNEIVQTLTDDAWYASKYASKGTPHGQEIAA